MKVVYRNNFNWWQRILVTLIGLKAINENNIEFNWGCFAPRFGLEFVISRGGYFDQRYTISICLGWGMLFIRLPFKTSILESCDPPEYGVKVHNSTLWLHLGGEMNNFDQCNARLYTWDIPYFTLNHEAWYAKCPIKGWINEDELDETELEKIKSSRPFIYKTRNDEEQFSDIKFYVRKGVWCRKWFPFLKLTSYFLEVEFVKPLGEDVGGWKGGTESGSFYMENEYAVEDCLLELALNHKL